MAWREAGRAAKLFGIDAGAAIGMIPYIFHWSWNTLYFSMACTAVFAVGQFMGVGPVELYRKIRFWMGGDYRPAPSRIGRLRDRMNAYLLDWWMHSRA